MRIEAAGGGCQQIGGNRTGKPGVFGPEFLDIGLHPVHQFLIGGAKIRTAGGRSVVAVIAGCGRSPMKVFRLGESLADQFGANGDSVLPDQTAIRLAETGGGKTPGPGR